MNTGRNTGRDTSRDTSGASRAPSSAPSTAGDLVTFCLGDRDYCTPLASVREVVRLQGLADLPGMEPPLAGVLDLRGTALPVLDLRMDADARGDVLVVDRDSGLVGIAVDRVRAVVAHSDLPPAGTARDADSPGVLPSYVTEVLRGPDGPVFRVDLEAMVASVRARP